MRLCCIHMAVIATPTVSQARSTPSKRSSMPASIIQSTSTASASAATQWAGRPAGALPSTIRAYGRRRNRGRASAKRRSSSRVFQQETIKPNAWEKKVAALVRLHRLGRQHLQRADGRLFQRKGVATASRRHHGPGDAEGRPAPHAHLLREAPTDIRRRPKRKPNCSAASIRLWPRARSAAEEDPIHDLHTAIQRQLG